MKSERPELVSFGRGGKGNDTGDRWTKGPSSIVFTLERSKANMGKYDNFQEDREKKKNREMRPRMMVDNI